MRKKSIIIAGYGSIGKRYASILEKKNFNLIIFDPKLTNKPKSKTLYLNNYPELSKEIKKNNVEIGIVSSLANTHYKNFKFFVKNRIDKILIEKPVTNNYSEFQKIINYKKKNKLFVSTHFKWSALNLHKIINNLESKEKLGRPFEFHSSGGANCLATGGIHWIDFFIRHFRINSNNIEITSRLKLDKINPRNNSFYNIGGTILLNHKNKISGILSFNNNSRLAPSQSLIYKSHLLKFDTSGNFKLYRTDKKLDRLKITRYGVPRLKKREIFSRKNQTLYTWFYQIYYTKKNHWFL